MTAPIRAACTALLSAARTLAAAYGRLNIARTADTRTLAAAEVAVALAAYSAAYDARNAARNAKH